MEDIKTIFDYALIIVTILPVVASVLRYLAMMTKAKGLKVLADQATNVVMAIEQSGLTGSAAKKQTAINKLVGVAYSLGIDITEDELSTLVEKSVYNLNDGAVKDKGTEGEETVKHVSAFDGAL